MIKRPPGVPREGRATTIGFYMLGGLEPGLLLALITVSAQWDIGRYFNGLLYIPAIQFVVMVPTIIAVSYGAPRVLAVFQWVCAVLEAVLPAIALAALSLFFLRSGPYRTMTVVTLVFCALLAPFAVFMRRARHRTRWLDPKSAPEEWEPPPVRRSR